MKIEILSMQEVNNYGSLLQAYSLKKILESLGHQVDFLPIERRDDDDILKQENILECDTSNNKAKTKSKKIDRYFFNRLSGKIRKARYVDVCKLFREEELNIKDMVQTQNKYDICVIGSDEVFNCLHKTSWGYTSQLFGNVHNADKVITYAASCGQTQYELLPEGVKQSINKAFSNISSMSVRDKNTYDFVKSFGLEPIYSLDPVVVGDFEKEIEAHDVSRKLPKKYCILYSYVHRFNSEEEIREIKAFCKRHGMELLCIQGAMYWQRSKKYELLSPFEVLSAFKHAEFVITDTFHGTIFSSKYASRFCVLTRESNINKLTDLITRLHIEKHQIKSISEIENIYELEKDQATIDRIIEGGRAETFEYLKRAL